MFRVGLTRAVQGEYITPNRREERQRMEELDQYFRVYANIDLDMIRENVINLKKNTQSKTEIMAVIKADGYGHGAVPIAHGISDLADRFGVATINEAVNLRKHNITKPINILGFTPAYYYEELLHYEITPTIYSYEMAEELSKYAVKMGRTALIHIKVDTGMGRIGFADSDESIQIIKNISELPNIDIEGIFTHFAKADAKDKSNANNQLTRFNKFIQGLNDLGINIPSKHCSNSAGIIDMPQANMTMVRAGISLYGLYPSTEVEINAVEIKPALSLYSHIIHIKDVNPGTGISYGAVYVADRVTTVATIPVGYGDGYPRNLTNKGGIIINGKRAPIIGRVCMDQFMVDITNIENVSVGDKVTLIGNEGTETITVEELSIMANRFHYEFLCDLGKRIPRVYYRNGKIIGTKDYFNDTYKDFLIQ